MVEDLPKFIDKVTFNQILEMDDDDEDRDFSKDIVFGFFTQVEQTLKDMHSSIESKDIKKLSSLGHFLKGSSATIGLTRIKDACEAIQNLDAEASRGGNNNEIIELAKKKLSVITDGLTEAQSYLNNFYGVN